MNRLGSLTLQNTHVPTLCMSSAKMRLNYYSFLYRFVVLETTLPQPDAQSCVFYVTVISYVNLEMDVALGGVHPGAPGHTKVLALYFNLVGECL